MHLFKQCSLMMVTIATVITMSSDPAWSADANKPHAHKGLVPGFQGEPKPVQLTAADTATLAKGDRVMKQVQQKDGGRGVAIFRVNAPAQTVWSVISNFAKYPDWVEGVDRTNVYKRVGNDIYVEFEISAMGFSYIYYIKHHYPIEKGYGTWTLDYSRDSDLDDSVGYWIVTPVPGNPAQTQVEYSVDVRLKGWVPGFIKTLLVNKGLKQATVWVKEQAEKQQAKTLAAHPS